MTRGSFCTTSIEPSASTLPSCSTVTLRAICETNSMSCSTTTSECRPASVLQMHPQTTVILDAPAAQHLACRDYYTAVHPMGLVE